MSKQNTLDNIKAWEDEAEYAEQVLRHAEEMCRMYYKMLDEETFEE